MLIWRGHCGATAILTKLVLTRATDFHLLAIMALQTDSEEIAPDWQGPCVSHARFAGSLDGRKRLSIDDDAMPANNRNERTVSKRAQHKAIKDAGGQW